MRFGYVGLAHFASKQISGSLLPASSQQLLGIIHGVGQMIEFRTLSEQIDLSSESIQLQQFHLSVVPDSLFDKYDSYAFRIVSQSLLAMPLLKQHVAKVYPRSVMFVNLLVAIIAPGMEATGP